jgi:hypothetical protein
LLPEDDPKAFQPSNMKKAQNLLVMDHHLTMAIALKQRGPNILGSKTSAVARDKRRRMR